MGFHTRFLVDQLHVSKSILMKLLIERDVMDGGPVCPQKHIAVYGETQVTKFKLPTAHELYHMSCISKQVVKI